MSADLHLHTHYSDGTFTPEELAARAAAAGLQTVALTDHDTVEGCPPMAAACARLGLEFIPAAELTAELAGAELHLLGYGLRVDHLPLLAALGRFQEVRQNRIREMVERVRARGLPLTLESVLALANCRSPGRPHVARALVAARLCSSVDEAFERFLRRDRPAWVPKARIDAADAIRLIHDAGGVAVLAHPGLNRVDPLLPTLVEHGLDGLEYLHSRHSPATREHYLGQARELGLLVTGGSDCHGLAKGEPLIGTVQLSPEHVERLRQAIAARQANPASPAPASS